MEKPKKSNVPERTFFTARIVRHLSLPEEFRRGSGGRCSADYRWQDSKYVIRHSLQMRIKEIIFLIFRSSSSATHPTRVANRGNFFLISLIFGIRPMSGSLPRRSGRKRVISSSPAPPPSRLDKRVKFAVESGDNAAASQDASAAAGPSHNSPVDNTRATDGASSTDNAALANAPPYVDPVSADGVSADAVPEEGNHVMAISHEELDAAIRADPTYRRLHGSEGEQGMLLLCLLDLIVKDAPGLDQSFRNIGYAMERLSSDQTLRRLMLECIASERYAPVRDHIRQFSAPSNTHTTPSSESLLDELEKLKVALEDQLRTLAQSEHVDLSVPESDSRFYVLQDGIGQLAANDAQVRARVDRLFERDSLLKLLLDATGTGKTTLVGEGMCTKLGAFMVTDTNKHSSVGSSNLSMGISMLEHDEKFVKELPEDPEHRRIVSESNMRKASEIFALALLSTLTILDWLLEYSPDPVEGEHGVPQETLRRWTHLQFVPNLGGQQDVFAQAMTIVQHIRDPDLVTQMINNIFRRIQNKYHDSFMWIILDEAQVATTKFPNAFYSEPNSENPGYRSSLRAMIEAWSSPARFENTGLLVSGTGLSLDVVKQGVASALLKPGSEWIVHSNTGSFEKKEDQMGYIMTRVWPDRSYDQLDEHDKMIIQRAWRFLRGRYRTTALYVVALRRFGTKSAHRILDMLVERLTNKCYSPTDGGKLKYEEPELVDIATLGTLMGRANPLHLERLDPLSKIHNNLQYHIRAAMMTWMIRREPYILPGRLHIMVTLDFARIVDCGTGIALASIFDDRPDVPLRLEMGEPIVILATMAHFDRQDGHISIAEHVGNQLRSVSNPSSRGFLMEDFVALSLLRIFDGTKSLKQLFRFHIMNSKTVPAFLKKPATLTCIIGRDNTGFITTDAGLRSGAGPGIGFQAKTMDDVRAFCAGQKEGQIFMFPPIQMGPDLIFLVRCGDQLVWFFLQVKCRVKDLSEEETQKAINSTNPQYFYKNSKGEQFARKSRPALTEEVRKLLSIPQNAAATRTRGRPKKRLDVLPVVRLLECFPGNLCQQVMDVNADEKVRRKRKQLVKENDREALAEEPNEEGYPLATFDILKNDPASRGLLEAMRVRMGVQQKS